MAGSEYLLPVGATGVECRRQYLREWLYDAGGELPVTTAFNFEVAETRTVTVTANDGKGGTDSEGVTVVVEDVDEPPSAPTGLTLDSATTASVERRPAQRPVASAMSRLAPRRERGRPPVRGSRGSPLSVTAASR